MLLMKVWKSNRLKEKQKLIIFKKGPIWFITKLWILRSSCHDIYLLISMITLAIIPRVFTVTIKRTKKPSSNKITVNSKLKNLKMMRSCWVSSSPNFLASMKCTTINQTTKINKMNTSMKKKKTKMISVIRWEMPNKQARVEIQETCSLLCLLRKWPCMKNKMTEFNKSKSMKRIKQNFKISKRNNHNSSIRNVNLILKSVSFLTICRVKWASSSTN